MQLLIGIGAAEWNQGSADKKRLVRYAFIVNLLVNSMFPQNSDNFPTQLSIYLHESGLPRRALDILSSLGICAGYERTRAALTSLVLSGQETVSTVGQSLKAVTCYDNFEFTEGVNEERLDQHKQFSSITTAMTNTGFNIPETGLLQSMFSPVQPLRTLEILQYGILNTELQKEVYIIHYLN
jgi:hypothetical protein